jgi:hypothetical protein
VIHDGNAVRVAIAGLDLLPWIEKAKAKQDLRAEDAHQAGEEYRHFLYLLWLNRFYKLDEMVTPTKLADKIWHVHLLGSYHYNPFCLEALGFIPVHDDDNYPEGSAALERAKRHTINLHETSGFYGFVRVYLGVEAKEPTRRHDPSAGAGGGPIDGKVEPGVGLTSPSTSDGGISDGGGAAACAGGCGGG